MTELFHFRLCRSFLLVDSEMGLCDVDKEGLRMMEDLAKPYAVIIGHFSDLKFILYCCKPTFIGVPEILTRA